MKLTELHDMMPPKAYSYAFGRALSEVLTAWQKLDEVHMVTMVSITPVDEDEDIRFSGKIYPFTNRTFTKALKSKVVAVLNASMKRHGLDKARQSYILETRGDNGATFGFVWSKAELDVEQVKRGLGENEPMVSFKH